MDCLQSSWSNVSCAQLRSPLALATLHLAHQPHLALFADLTHLDLQAAVHLPPKKVTTLACPSSIPLKTLILGSDAQPVAFLEQLFTAAKPTLVRLELYISKATAPALVPTFPTIASSIKELALIGPSAAGTPMGWGHSPADQSQFTALLSLCTAVCLLGWTDVGFHGLGRVLDRLPHEGALVEGLDLNQVGYRRDEGAFTRAVLDRPGLCSLRTIRLSTSWGIPVHECKKRRITVSYKRW